MQEAYDVVVIGAGPVGSNAARLLAHQKHRVLLVEEHPRVGQPVQCAGLVTPRTFEHTPFPIGDLHQNDLRGAIIYAPNGQSIAFETETIQAQAMDRAGFDQRMAAHAVDAGVELREATKAVGAKRTASGVQITLQGPQGRYDVTARLVVGADGIRGSVARWFDFPSVQEIVSCYEAELAGCHIPAGKEHLIPMFAGHDQAPGFFSWIIPVGHGRTRTGLAVAPGMNLDSAKKYYERMFEDAASAGYLHGAKPTYLIIGGIPLGLRSRLVQDRVILVGDAAGMAKPTSGGGIYYGLVASEILARVAGPALADDTLDRGTLLPYEKQVKRVLGRELRKGWALRAVYKRLRDEDFNTLAQLLGSPRARQVIESKGDIDYPSRLVFPLLRASPGLLWLFIKAMLRQAQP